jgi:hypothetical protein
VGLTEWISDLRASRAEMRGRGHGRYFFETSWRTVLAETKLRLGLNVEFPRSVAKAADECDAEDTARGFGSSAAVERFEKCRAAGDRAGMEFWRSVGVYSMVSAMHGTGKIRLIDG